MQETENENKNSVSTGELDQKNDRIYELGYLLVPTIPEENVLTSYGNLKALVTSFGGQIISDDMPKKIVLAYTMLKVHKNVRNKFNEAYFSWIKFEMSAEKVLELKKKLDLDPEIIRFLLIKTVKENTIASKRFIHKGAVRRMAPVAKKEGESEIVTEIDKEEIDKEIDAMVVAS